MKFLRFFRKWSMLQAMRLRHAYIPSLLLLSALQGAMAAEDPYVEGEVIVTFRQDVPEETAKTSLGRRSLRLAERYDRITSRQRKFSGMVREKSRTTADLIAQLKNDPTVEFAEPNYLRHATLVRPNDTYYSRLWGLENTGQTVNGTTGTSGVDTRFLQAWNLARTTGTEPVVAVIDTGADLTHPDLIGNLWTNTAEIPGNGLDDDGNGLADDVHGYDFSSSSGNVFDSGYHGTHVCGTVAGSPKNGRGVIGLQYRSKVIPMKVSTDGTNFLSSAIISSCNYAVALKQQGKANIVAVNASYGGGSFSNAERNAIIALRDAGIIFCAAAANDGLNNDTTAEYPANYDVSNIIAVAAITQTNTLASFSNYGATTVDIAAPGVNIYSTYPTNLVSRTSSVTVGSASYTATNLNFAGTTPLEGITRPVISCGTAQTAADFPAAVNGNIALILRGTNTFADKTTRAKAAGAVGVIIYNNVVDSGTWTMLSAGDWLPALQITKANGEAILASLPATATMVNYVDPSFTGAYQYLNGTSMACPHVAGAAAFAAWNFPSETMAQRIARILNNNTQVPALSGKVSTGGRLDLLKIIDTDSDGLPDWWETENFNTLARTGTEDTDGDGFTNLTEFLSNYSPTSASSHLSFSDFQPAVSSGGNNISLAFPTVADRSYKVEWSENLQPPWTTLGTTITGTGAPIQVMDANTAGRRFYRLSLLDD